MRIKELIQSDTKQAMLAGDKDKAAVLQSIKSAFLDYEITAKKRDEGLSDEDAMNILAKEAKKRQESADLYRLGGSETQAEAEEYEKEIIESYLPDNLSDEELQALVDTEVSKLDAPSPKDMGGVIANVRQAAGPSADGAIIASKVKEALQQ